ncbi:hypothetical protein [Nocardia brasiliensis]|uniref:hypothetical protein n=1 Tax=Nocardia brasiliensis TaxID=37326 RepID=UPI002456AE89|nr:hypothetical protein [Nocardia brasiliensis]
MTEQSWQVHARAALAAAIEGDHVEASVQTGKLLNLEDSGNVVIRAALLWMDTLLAAAPPPPPGWRPPESAPGMSAGQIWSLRLLTARANNDMEAGESLFAEAASADFDHLIECLMTLLTFIGIQLRGRPDTPAR